MTDSELRVEALRQASDDEKHFVSDGITRAGSGPPQAEAVVKRAEAYFQFLSGKGS